MPMKENVVEAVIGAVVLLVGGLFVSYAYSTTGAAIRSGGYELTARFQSASGLGVGTDVRVSGIKVGSVVKQSLDPKTYQAVLTLVVDQAVRLPSDSTAVVASEGILGGNYLELKPGFEETMLKPGGVVQYTQGSVDVLSLIGRFIGSSATAADKAGKSPAPAASPGAANQP